MTSPSNTQLITLIPRPVESRGFWKSTKYCGLIIFMLILMTFCAISYCVLFWSQPINTALETKKISSSLSDSFSKEEIQKINQVIGIFLQFLIKKYSYAMSGQLNFYSCDFQLRNSIKLNLTKSFISEDFYLVKWLKGKNETCKMKNLLWNTKYFNLFFQTHLGTWRMLQRFS